MGGILKKIMEAFKQPLIDGIIWAMNGINFVDIQKASQIVGADPQSFNGQLFNLAKGANETLIVPIASIIITFIAINELISMVIDKNNMHEVDTFMFFKWVIKTYIAIYLVSHSYDFVMSIFSIFQNALSGFSGTVGAITDLSEQMARMQEGLKDLDMIQLFGILISILISSMFNMLIRIFIWVICVTRILEIYMIISVSSLPFATLTSGRYGSVGDSYIKTSIALGLQGLFMMLVIAGYTIISQKYMTDLWTGTMNFGPGMFLQPLGVDLLLFMALKRTGDVSKRLVGA